MDAKPKKCILIVDDNKSLLVSLNDFLAFEGFDVLTATSGEDALAQMEERTPHLIVLDISMPGMGGIAFLKQISGGAGRPKCPVVVLTARAAMEEYFSTVPVDGFLAKPCSERVLLDKIKAVLASREPKTKPAQSQKVRVLVGDDDPDMMQGIRTVFRADGDRYEIENVLKGPEVLEKALVFLPNVVLLRSTMRDMNGPEVAALLRMVSKTKSVPIILYGDARMLPGERMGRGLHETKVERDLATTDPTALLEAVREVLGMR